MTEQPTIYFVQRSVLGSGPAECLTTLGWETVAVALDLNTAKSHAEDLERVPMIANSAGQTPADLSAYVTTIARVITAAELLEQDGAEALERAKHQTRGQLKQIYGE